MDNTIKICLKNVKKTTTQKSIEIPDDFIEIIPKYLCIYHGCWIKYSDSDGNGYTGGYLIDIEKDIVFLRNIRKDVFELVKKDHVFYAKEDTPHHRAVKSIVQEKEKLASQVLKFNMEKQNYLQTRKIQSR